MTLFTHHRAGWGLASVGALALLMALSPNWPASEAGYWATRLLLASLVVAGLVAISTSPYYRILYREAPLKRAMTGETDLDERELALRDRAHGMTYYVLVSVTLGIAFGAAVLSDAGWISLDEVSVLDLMLPYFHFAFTLPVILLEWFEPSHLWSEPLGEDEEDA